jgi:hypothetical protein
MHLSGLKKLPGHEGLDTDLHLWKKASAGHKARTGMSYTIYQCPLLHWRKCMKTIRVGRGGGILIMEQCGLHDVHSHEEDGSKYLKYVPIISLSEAAITAPNLSVSVIRRNMLLHDSPAKTIGAEHSQCVMLRVRHARKNLTTKQLGGFMIADSFGSLTEFCIRSSWS